MGGRCIRGAKEGWSKVDMIKMHCMHELIFISKGDLLELLTGNSPGSLTMAAS